MVSPMEVEDMSFSTILIGILIRVTKSKMLREINIISGILTLQNNNNNKSTNSYRKLTTLIYKKYPRSNTPNSKTL